MRKLSLLSVMFMTIDLLLFAQEVLTTGELNVWVINNMNHSEVEIKMELKSSLCWDEDHNITNLFEGGSLYTSLSNQYLEFLACWETSVSNYFRTFGLGYYKFTAKVNGIEKDSFYIDYRTSDLPYNFNSGGMGDINITFNVSDGKFYYLNTRILFPKYTSIWQERPWISHLTTGLEPLPPDNFELSKYSGHPYLTWYHSYDEGDYWTGYLIFRSVVSGRGSNPGIFSKIATLSEVTTNYTDEDFAINGPMTAYYKVTAINGEKESESTEMLDVYVGFFKESLSEINYNYNLSQNYPNPFNPFTTISFSIKENTNVTLRVFDILGREVVVLVNEELNAGNHKVQFDGTNLESGVYFYEIRTNDFTDVRKLVLIR